MATWRPSIASRWITIVRFAKGACKEDIARPYLRAAERDGRFGVVLIGVAQEKAYAWRGWRDGGNDEHPHFEFGRQAVYVNHYYFYICDRDWGPGFLKTNAYAPYPVWVYLNGHEWAKRQAARQEVEFGALDNGFGACDDAQALADICASLGHEHVLAFCERWMSVLPSPLTAAERRRYAYRYSIRQLELSDTRVFDRPAAGRAWFEQTIRDQPDLGHPDKVQVVFGRKVTRRTPGRFVTEVITSGVAPVIQAHYKHSKVKQYLKEGRALRTETTVNDPYDFAINRSLSAENWGALLALGHDINARLLAAQLQACQCAPDPTALQAIVLPSLHDDLPAPRPPLRRPARHGAPGLPMPLEDLFEGLTNRSLRALVAELIPSYTARQATSDLRRKGLIRRVPRSHRYELTDHGRMIAVFFTKTYTRIVNPALAELDPHLPDAIARTTTLGKPWRDFEHALDHKIKQAAIAA